MTKKPLWGPYSKAKLNPKATWGMLTTALKLARVKIARKTQFPVLGRCNRCNYMRQSKKISKRTPAK